MKVKCYCTNCEQEVTVTTGRKSLDVHLTEYKINRGKAIVYCEKCNKRTHLTKSFRETLEKMERRTKRKRS